MAGTTGRRTRTPSTDTRRSVARAALKRTLERDTAVQGERPEDDKESTAAPTGKEPDGSSTGSAAAGSTKNRP